MANSSQFYFAWVNSSETTFGAEHMREDELIFSFELKHDESQVAELTLEITNPHIGLLAPGRPLWAWFSWSDGSNVWPLFFGRLVGIPDDLFLDIIKVVFVAKPLDYVEQRLALADSMRVLPFYDPIFIDQKKQSDPDVVLEGYSKLWHVDRVSHVVTVSDIIAGEDGVEEFTPNEVFYDGVSVKIAGSPLMVCEIDASVSWVQCDHTGVIQFKTVSNVTAPKLDIGAGLEIKQGASIAGFNAPISPNQPMSLQFAQTEWPSITRNYVNDSQGPHEDGELMEEHESWSGPNLSGIETLHEETHINPDPETGQAEEYSLRQSFKSVTGVEITGATPPGTTPPTKPPTSPELPNEMQIGTEVEQNRTEILHVRVLADVQPVLTEATEGEDDVKQTLSMNARDAVEAGVATPSDGVYFPTARGLQSLEYLLMVARAHLLAGSRVVEISWECSFPKIATSGMSCRKNATIEDSRLPGGTVLGKVVSYGMKGDGDKGEFIGNVTINSAVGYGNAIVAAAGTPVYCDEGYVDVGYQHYTGRFAAAVSGDMTFEPLAFEDTGLQLPISTDQVLIRHEFHDGGAAPIVQQLLESAAAQLRQITYEPSGTLRTGPSQAMIDQITAQMNLNAAVDRAIADHPSWVEIELAPVQKISTDVEYDAVCGPLMVPMQINLAAPSSP